MKNNCRFVCISYCADVKLPCEAANNRVNSRETVYVFMRIQMCRLDASLDCPLDLGDKFSLYSLPELKANQGFLRQLIR